jgi:hypothetical protein
LKTLYLFAPAALLLVGAMHPPTSGPHRDGAHEPLPPCSATVRDRCRQRSDGSAHNPHHGPNSELNSVVAADRPYRPAPVAAPVRPERVARNYPPCSATVTDRCIQTGGRRYARQATQVRTVRRVQTRQVQYAYRYAGERG